MDTPAMSLYAAGCNTWGQLDFQVTAQTGLDLPTFTEVLSGEWIGEPISGLVFTLVDVDGVYRLASYMRDRINMHEAATTIATATGMLISFGRHGDIVVRDQPDADGKVHRQGIDLRNKFTQVVAYDTGFAMLYESGVVATLGDARYVAPLGRIPSEANPAEQFVDLEWPVDISTDRVKRITACGWRVAALTKLGVVYM